MNAKRFLLFTRSAADVLRFTVKRPDRDFTTDVTVLEQPPSSGARGHLPCARTPALPADALIVLQIEPNGQIVFLGFEVD